ncbi:hypothetical protein DL98DRAFT_530414 [Cadophora sp. DSE1049]|nr:hypothetical protein DL98DRAFT_530414 [Cadophora sp. DSE1049]
MLNIMNLVAFLSFYLLTLTSVVLSAPSAPLTDIDSGYANYTTDVAAIQRRDTNWVPGEKVVELWEGTIPVTVCNPNNADWTMCRVNYYEKSTWGGWGVVDLYDNKCNRIGRNDHVARNWLDHRWSLSSQLRMYVDIKVTHAWTDYLDKGIEIWYHKYHAEPFVKNPYPQWNMWLWKGRIFSKELGQIYSVFGTPFKCQGDPDWYENDEFLLQPTCIQWMTGEALNASMIF